MNGSAKTYTISIVQVKQFFAEKPIALNDGSNLGDF